MFTFSVWNTLKHIAKIKDFLDKFIKTTYANKKTRKPSQGIGCKFIVAWDKHAAESAFPQKEV